MLLVVFLNTLFGHSGLPLGSIRRDEANRLLTTTGAFGTPYAARTSSTYDFVGNVTAVTDPNSHTTVNRYDALNRLTDTTDAAGNHVGYGYDPEGNRTSVTDGNNHTTTFAYDGLKRNVRITDAAGRSTAFTFDGVNKVARLDSLNQTTTYLYNNRHKLTQVLYPSRAQDNRFYTYDLVDNLLSVQEPAPSKNGRSNVANVYDALNRITQETSSGVTHQYAYDLAGNRLTTAYGNGGLKLVSAYDTLNRLTQLAEGDGVTFVRTSGYGYDLSGNIVRKSLPNGEVTSKSYDGLNRVVNIEDHAPSSALEYRYQSSYDLASNVTQIVETYAASNLNRTVTNTYDWINRLSTENAVGAGAYAAAYTYDAANNRTKLVRNNVTTTYAYNNLNQLTSASGVNSATYTYDANGNRLTRSIHGATPDQYSYDVENRLVQLVVNSTFEVSNSGAPSSLTLGTYNYQYDYRTRRVLRDESAAGGNVTTVVFSGGTSVQEIENGQITVQYVRGSDYGGGIGGIWYTLRSGVPSFTHYNSRGDVVAKTNNAATVTYQALYEAYGKRTVETGNTLDRQKANTKDEDPTGLLDEGMRYRDLDTGVFITKDPAGFVNGPNVYTYVGQNPWTKFDPQGLWFGLDDAIASGVGALIGVAVQGVSDAVQGHLSSYKDYVASGVGGAAAGEAGLYTGGLGSGAAFGAASNLTKQALNNIDGTQKGIDVGSLVTDTAIGAVGGKVGEVLAPVLEAGAKQITNSLTKSASEEVSQATEAVSKNGGCFIKGTLVLTSHGEVPIESIKAGDTIVSCDVDQGKIKLEHVKSIFSHCTEFWVDIQIGGVKVVATRGHRFWVESLKKWIPASELKPGMRLLGSNGHIATINKVAIRRLNSDETTYNFFVAETHTYFVGHNNWLVHNGDDATPPPPPPPPQRRAQTGGDKSFPSESAARREAMRRYNVPTSQANNYTRETDPASRKNKNLQGSKGEPSELLKTKDVNGNDVNIDHHSNGHEFKDNNTYEDPHYHGPDGEHLSYHAEKC